MESFPPSTAGAFGAADRSLNVQPVHSSGLTRVVHTLKSNRLFTGGDDYLVRILPARPDPNVQSMIIDDATKAITWIDADDDHLIVASEDGCVRVYQHSLPPNEELASSAPTDIVCILSRTALAARCVALERKVQRGKSARVAVCSDELIIKVVDLEDPSHVQLLSGHERGTRAASWCPTQELLATSACDGTVKLWNMSTPQTECIRTLPNVLATSTGDSELTAEVVWHPSGKEFVLPSKTHDVVVYGQGPDWRMTRVLVAPETSSVRTPTGDISSLAFSSNGLYLAVATTDGQVTVWDWNARKPIGSKRSSALVTSLSWNPTHNTLAWSDNAGQLTRWSHPVDDSRPSPCEPVTFESAKELQDGAEFDDLFDEFDDQEEDALSVVPADDVGFNDAKGPLRHKMRSRRLLGNAESILQKTKPQAAFQPTATPMHNARRYLAFNTIGALVAMDQDTHQSISFESFDAGARRNWRFIDESGYNMASIGVHGALLACPERKGVNNGHDSDDELDEGLSKDKGRPSNIFFKPFEVPGGWTVPGSEWSVDLPRGEAVVAVAMAGRRSAQMQTPLDTSTAIVATSAGYLRFFSGAGLQRYIWAFGSQIVTMAAGNRFLLVVHRNGAAAEEHQNLHYTMIDVVSFEKRQEGVLPLVKDATLKWVGFSEMDTPVTFDSRGVLMLLDRALGAPGQARWVPGLDTRTIAAKEGEEADEDAVSRVKYWPVGMDGTILLAVMLKGHAHPDASSASRPLIQELQLSMPVADAKSITGALEEQFVRSNQLASFARAFEASLQQEEVDDEYYAELLEQPMANTTSLESDADVAILQLMQHAVRGDKHQRALDSARELHTLRTLEPAKQIANFYHQSSLMDRIWALRDWVTGRAEREKRALIALPFASAPSAAHEGVLVASSPSPALHNHHHDSRAAAVQVKKALGRDFDTSTSARKYGGSHSELAKLGHSPSSTWTASGTTSIKAERYAGGQAESEMDRYDDGAEELNSQDNTDYGRENDSPVASSKRRAPEEVDDDDIEMGSLSKRSKDATATSPFANKINRDFTVPKTAASATTTAKNPFARTAGMTRDRSMHKSNSFFDRVDSAAASSKFGSSAGKGTAAKKKQATLFGMTFSRAPSGGAASSLVETSVPAATPAFGSESQTETQESGADGEGEESVRQMLTAAQELDKESQVQLEETQYDDQDEESQQPFDQQESHASSAPISVA